MPVTAATAFGTGASTGTTTAVVTTPAGSHPADMLVLYVARGTSGTTWSAPGFTAVPVASGASGSGQVLYRVLDGSAADPGATFTITGSPGGIFGGVCVRVSLSAYAFDPAPTSGQVNVSGTSIPSNDLVTTLPNDLLLWFGAIDAGAGGVPEAITLPAGYAATPAGQSNTSSGSGTNVGVACGSITQALAGDAGSPAGSVSPTPHVSLAALVSINTQYQALLPPQIVSGPPVNGIPQNQFMLPVLMVALAPLYQSSWAGRWPNIPVGGLFWAKYLDAVQLQAAGLAVVAPSTSTLAPEPPYTVNGNIGVAAGTSNASH